MFNSTHIKQDFTVWWEDSTFFGDLFLCLNFSVSEHSTKMHHIALYFIYYTIAFTLPQHVDLHTVSCSLFQHLKGFSSLFAELLERTDFSLGNWLHVSPEKSSNSFHLPSFSLLIKIHQCYFIMVILSLNCWNGRLVWRHPTSFKYTQQEV